MHRFRLGNVIERKDRHRELRGPVDWLEGAKLVLECHPVDDRPSAPLLSQARPNIFKPYLFDVRLASHVASQAFALRFCGTLARDAMPRGRR